MSRPDTAMPARPRAVTVEFPCLPETIATAMVLKALANARWKSDDPVEFIVETMSPEDAIQATEAACRKYGTNWTVGRIDYTDLPYAAAVERLRSWGWW